MKNRSLLSKKIDLFYIDEKRETGKKMRIEADRQFEQNKIRKLNKKYNIDMFSLKTFLRQKPWMKDLEKNLIKESY